VSSAPDLTARVLRHERAFVIASIAALAGVGWWYLVREAAPGGSSAPMAMGQPPFPALLLMWSLMMVAMMLPSATPAILLYSRVRQGDSRGAIARTWVFVAGYLIVWLVFALAAALAQRLLIDGAPMLDSAPAQGALLIAAGVYQLSPFKSACLRQCRGPAQFLSRHWRPGYEGAVLLGVRHGAYCLGCCWMLMLLLFVGGVMNLLWIAALTLLVTAEKLLPQGRLIARVSAVLLLAAGLARLLL
jgi:predicted metal-binding membrane protein